MTSCPGSLELGYTAPHSLSAHQSVPDALLEYSHESPTSPGTPLPPFEVSPGYLPHETGAGTANPRGI